MKLTIRNKILFGFAVLFSLSVTVQIFTYFATKNYILSQLNYSLSLETGKGAGEIEAFFTDLYNTSDGLGKIFSENYNLATAGETKITTVSEYIMNKENQISQITYLSPVGQELYMYNIYGQIPQQQLSYEVSTDPFLSAASGTTSISKVYYLEGESGPHIDIFSPIFSSDHAVIAVVKLQISLESLRENIEDIKVGQSGFMYIVDSTGLLIAHPSQSFVLQRPNLSSRKIIAMTLAHKTPMGNDLFYTNEKNIPVIANAEEIPGIDWVAVIEEPVSEAYSFLYYVKDIFVDTLAGFTIFLILAALLLSESITNPIKKLKDSVELIEKGKIETNPIIESHDEIEILSRSFNSMLGELLKRETLLKKEKKETETILQSLTDGVIALDPSNAIISFNGAAEKISRITASKAVGKHVDEVMRIYYKDAVIPFLEYNNNDEQKSGTSNKENLYLLFENNEKTIITLKTDPILVKEKREGTIITFHDISQEQQLEEMKVDFVSMAAHELRTPLTAIRGYTSILQTDYTSQIDGPGKEIINRLTISEENLGNLIDNLLSVSKIEQNVFTVALSPLDITNVLKNAVETARQQMLSKNQNFITNIEENLPAIMADNFRITQVILNLLANASTYTREGGTITINAAKQNDILVTTVEDTGEGIPKDAIPKLFTKFFRVAGTLEQGSKGTGLGLFITKSIIDMHKGKIWVESEVDKGTKFTFTLPFATAGELKDYQHIHEKKGLIIKSQSDIINSK